MANNHPFFSLPPELHTEIFTLTCSPSPTRVCTAGPSYYTAFTTGISLSRVSKYVNAASAPARYRSVVLYGWQEMLGFERMLAKYPPNHSRVRYMTLVADELPQDPSRLLTKESYPLSAPSSSNKLGLERLLLDVIARILRAVGKDLYELEIGFQAIEHVKDPLAYLSLPGPLCFPNLATMFYACSPSNTLPWGTPSSSLSPSPFSLSSPVTPRFSCSNLKDLTVVCNDSSAVSSFQGDNPNDETQDDAPDDDIAEPRVVGTAYESIGAGLDTRTIQFPALTTLTLLASTPAQALTVIDVHEAAWDVGSTLDIDVEGLRRRILGHPNNLPGEAEGEKKASPSILRSVVLRPKTRWNEKWESLRDVVRRQQETETKGDRRKDKGEQKISAKFDLFVLKPGEQL